jgi:hypothetical protein
MNELLRSGELAERSNPDVNSSRQQSRELAPFGVKSKEMSDNPRKETSKILQSVGFIFGVWRNFCAKLRGTGASRTNLGTGICRARHHLGLRSRQQPVQCFDQDLFARTL